MSSHRHAQTPYQFSMRDLARRPGAQRKESSTFPAPAELGTEIIGVPEGAEVELDLSFESVSEGIWVSGRVYSEAVGQCGRCLTEVQQDVDSRIQALFYYPDVDREDDEDADDVYDFDGELIDLEDIVRDAVVVSLPFTPLCDPDCLGLCDQCGVRLAENPDHTHQVIDPRWAALERLTEQKES